MPTLAEPTLPNLPPITELLQSIGLQTPQSQVLPTLEQCVDTLRGGRGQLLLLLREARFTFGQRRKIASAIEQLLAEPNAVNSGPSGRESPSTASSAPQAGPEGAALAATVGPASPSTFMAVSPAVEKAAAEAAAALLTSPADSNLMGEYHNWKQIMPLGQGQYGTVYLIRGPDGRKAVDKRVQLSGLSEQQRSDTYKEIDLLRRLEHHYVVRCYHAYADERVDTDGEGGAVVTGTLHILMEYCDGGALDTKIQRQKEGRTPFDDDVIRAWVLHLTEALAHIHALRVIHRDLKSANILLASSSGGREIAKLGDFGISRLM